MAVPTVDVAHGLHSKVLAAMKIYMQLPPSFFRGLPAATESDFSRFCHLLHLLMFLHKLLSGAQL
jgi:hypothetical protein